MTGSKEDTPPAPSTRLDTPHVTYSYDNGILFGAYRKGITIDLKTAQEVVAYRLEIFKGRSYPAVADVRGIKVVTKEASNYFAREGIVGLDALAIITGNYLTATMSNLFIKFSKPKIPTRMFKTKEEALKWVKQFVKEPHDNTAPWMLP